MFSSSYPGACHFLVTLPVHCPPTVELVCFLALNPCECSWPAGSACSVPGVRFTTQISVRVVSGDIFLESHSSLWQYTEHWTWFRLHWQWPVYTALQLWDTVTQLLVDSAAAVAWSVIWIWKYLVLQFKNSLQGPCIETYLCGWWVLKFGMSSMTSIFSNSKQFLC